jgi:hypothetical protein
MREGGVIGTLRVVRRGAIMSDDGLYRYSLSRRWGRGPRIVWIMLNPSRADGQVDDPTIRRCIGFSRAWGYGVMEVVNLYALRTPEPRVLREHPDPVGPENDRWIALAGRGAAEIVLAWGAFPWAEERGSRVLELLSGREPRCLGLTRSGGPRHPLYVAGATTLRAMGRVGACAES